MRRKMLGFEEVKSGMMRSLSSTAMGGKHGPVVVTVESWLAKHDCVSCMNGDICQSVNLSP